MVKCDSLATKGNDMTSIQSFFNSIMSDQTTALIAFGVAVLVALLDLIATWRVYTKAGQGGWKCLIPLYNSYTLYRISWRAGMFWLVFFLTFIGWALFDAEVLATTFTQIASYVTILQIVGAQPVAPAAFRHKAAAGPNADDLLYQFQ